MLDLAIRFDEDAGNVAVVETNRGERLRALEWPQDCDFQLVAFDPSGQSCEVISAEGLAEGIAEALAMVNEAAPLKGGKPDWYRRLERCAALR